MNSRRTFWRSLAIGGLSMAAGVFLAACGGGGGGGGGADTSGTPQGVAQVHIMDAPGLEYDHVYVTVKEVWFHLRDDTPGDAADWLRYPVQGGAKTVDLTTLAHGVTDITSGKPIFGNLTLPIGEYRQIRILLAPTFGPLEPSAQAAGLTRNNQVVINGGVNAPLHIAGHDQGLVLLGRFTVAQNQPMRIAVDFDLSHDIIKFALGSLPEFILKSRLRYFDLDNSGAIVGTVDPASLQSPGNPNGGFNFVIKAEHLNADGSRYVVNRFTTIRPDGSFVLYPVHVNADGTPRNVDIVLRGRNVETTIVKGVPVRRNTDPQNNPTNLGPAITMVPGTEYQADPTPLNPTGAWVNFYQTLTGTGNAEVPYEIRFRHLNPFTGRFADPIHLSTGNLHWGNYNNGQAISLASAVPIQGAGKFDAIADAFLFKPSNVVTVAPPVAPSTVASFTIPTLATDTGVASDQIGFNLQVAPALQGLLNTGRMIAVRDGYIVNAVDVSALVAANGGNGAVTNLPGGPSTVIRRPFYRLFAIAGHSANPLAFSVGSSGLLPINLANGSVTGINITLR
jgi:hypothetical protein